MAEVKIIFTYNGQNEIIECKKEEYMFNIYKRYAMKIQVDLKKLYFLCNRSLINPENKLEKLFQKMKGLLI